MNLKSKSWSLLVCLAVCIAVTLGCRLSTKAPDADAVVEAFRGAGLEVENVRPDDQSNFLVNLPCDFYWFDTPMRGEQTGGAFLICKSEKDRDEVVRYYKTLNDASILFRNQVYYKGLVIVDLPGKMDPILAAKYGAALP